MVYVNNCSNCSYYSFCIIEKNSRNYGEGYSNENWCFNHSDLSSDYPEFINEEKFIEYQNEIEELRENTLSLKWGDQ